jgi:ABC-type multidrug transport system fused ATPase/permease subunit
MLVTRAYNNVRKRITDPREEAFIQRSLGRLLVGHRSVVITHRLSTAKNTNRILVVENGRIAERGTHASLLEKHGLYSDLYRRQFREPVPTTPG